MMASNWVFVELQQLSGSGSTRKDSVEKFKKILQKILNSKDNILFDLKAFIEAGTDFWKHFCPLGPLEIFFSNTYRTPVNRHDRTNGRAQMAENRTSAFSGHLIFYSCTLEILLKKPQSAI